MIQDEQSSMMSGHPVSFSPSDYFPVESSVFQPRLDLQRFGRGFFIKFQQRMVIVIPPKAGIQTPNSE